MWRVRFRASAEDYRPVNWPVEHPYWCSGHGDDYAIIVSYADDLSYIFENWPEAGYLEIEQAEHYIFTERFPKPEWFAFSETDGKQKKRAGSEMLEITIEKIGPLYVEITVTTGGVPILPNNRFDLGEGDRISFS